MARDYARIMTAIWDNKEFCNLTEGSQRAYLLLVTQPDISAAGVLGLRVRRWSTMSQSSTPETLSRFLKELEEGRFIVTDWTTEELLIRSFIRWDAGFNNPKRKPVIVRAGAEVRSARIGGFLEVEFRRCGLLPDPPPNPTGSQFDRDADTPADSLSDTQSKINRVQLEKEPFPQVDRLSDPYALEDGVVVTYLSREDTTTHNPQPPPTAGAEAPHAELAIVPAEQINAGTVVAAWAEAFAETGNRPLDRFRKQVGKEARELLAVGNDPDRVVEAAKSCGTKGRATLATELSILSGPRPSGRTTQDARVHAGLDLARRWEAEDNQTHPETHHRAIGGIA